MQMTTLVRGAMLAAALLSVSCGGALDDAAPTESQQPTADEMQSQDQRIYECSDGNHTVYCRDNQNCCYQAGGLPPYCTIALCP